MVNITKSIRLTDEDLANFLKKYKDNFSKIYKEKHWSLFKENADKFFDFFREIYTNLPNIRGMNKACQEELKARIFLGIGCELLLKAVYLKNGYLINLIDKGKLKKLGKNIDKPYKISKVPFEYINKDGTEGLRYYLDKLEIFFDGMSREKCNAYVKKGLEIVKLWRNKEAHIGRGYHSEDITNWIDIRSSLTEIYKVVFGEKLKPLFPNNKKMMFSPQPFPQDLVALFKNNKG